MLEIAYADWVSLMFRWLHVVAGISWIGTSFYFIFLDLSLRKHANLPDGVGGEAWNVHGGGFYLMRKYVVAPAEMPKELHWFKYEAYVTWLSGFALLAVIYYWGAESYLIDKDVLDLESWEAILISMAFFASGWIIYDLLCRSPFSTHSLLLSAAVFVLIAFAAYFLTHIFSGRAAFVHVGAMVGSIMVGNVFFIIIPNQKKVVKSLLAGEEPDPRLGAIGKHRSTHNNYLTLPVVLMMISQHYPMLYDNEFSWLVVTLILLVGASIRHFFNLMHTGKPIFTLRWQWPTGAALMVVLIVLLSWQPAPDPNAEQVEVPSAVDVLAIAQSRCASCHAVKPSDPDIEKAPGSVMLETVADIRKHSARILKQSVLSKAMPLGNKTRMTDEERKALGAWIRAGMPEGKKGVIRFTLNGTAHEVGDVSPTMTMLDYVRENLHMTGTKEGCAEGDCGACTVVRVIDGRFEAVNSCLMQIGQADGLEILTVEGLEAVNGGKLTPVQDAMATGDGTQCGFCTPGFIGALFALEQSGEDVSDDVIHDALAGNLCRCTGYRPIVEAARAACGKIVDYTPKAAIVRSPEHATSGQVFHAPETLAELTRLRAEYPDAMLLSGGTDLGLSVSKDRRQPAAVIHTAHVAELLIIEETDDTLVLGAAVSYTNALPYIDRLYLSFAEMIRRIGSRQIRNLGTIGGNIGNASPIGDTPPCLIALDATLTLASASGAREIAIEDFFLDYRKTDLRADEVISSIRIPKLTAAQSFRTYKVSKRYDQDISAVIGAYRLTMNSNTVAEARIAYGGMAATPKRANAMEAALTGAAWSEEAASDAGAKAAEDFSPLTDHRATSAYRALVAANLCTRLYRDLAGIEDKLEVVRV